MDLCFSIKRERNTVHAILLIVVVICRNYIHWKRKIIVSKKRTRCWRMRTRQCWSTCDDDIMSVGSLGNISLYIYEPASACIQAILSIEIDTTCFISRLKCFYSYLISTNFWIQSDTLLLSSYYFFCVF